MLAFMFSPITVFEIKIYRFGCFSFCVSPHSYAYCLALILSNSDNLGLATKIYLFFSERALEPILSGIFTLIKRILSSPKIQHFLMFVCTVKIPLREQCSFLGGLPHQFLCILCCLMLCNFYSVII